MRKGTILLNTYAGKNNPLRVSLYLGKTSSNGNKRILTLYTSEGKLKQARYEAKELYEHLVPVGYTDILERFAKEVSEVLEQSYETEMAGEHSES